MPNQMKIQFYSKLTWFWHTADYDCAFDIYHHYAGFLCWQFKWYSKNKRW